MIISNAQVDNPIFNNPILKAIASYGGVLMGLLGMYYFTQKLLDKKPGIIIDENGIYDNTTAFTFGLIPWSDIAQITERTVQASIASKQHFVTIILVNPDEYINRETNSIKRSLLKANAKSSGSPVHISTNGLKTNHKDLIVIMNEAFAKYKC